MSETNSRVKIFGATARYVQGPGALAHVGPLAKMHGPLAVLVIDAYMHEVLGGQLVASCASAGVTVEVVITSDEVRRARFEELAAGLPEAHDFGCVIAVGGGKAIDMGKGVALTLGVPVITVPTVASNDSPASRAIAIYNDQHVLTEVAQLPSNPSAVVVDTEVLITAPARLLAAGIGDAIAKRYEADACARGTGLTQQGTRPLGVGRVASWACADVLMRDGEAALSAVGRGEITDEFEHVVEAIILLSALGFENGGLSVAHAMTRGLMAVPQSATYLHGEHVAYGLLVQLALSVATEGAGEFEDMQGFLSRIGLPVSLRGLGLTDPADHELSTIVEQTLTARNHLANFPQPVGAGELMAALAAVEKLADRTYVAAGASRVL